MTPIYCSTRLQECDGSYWWLQYTVLRGCESVMVTTGDFNITVLRGFESVMVTTGDSNITVLRGWECDGYYWWLQYTCSKRLS